MNHLHHVHLYAADIDASIGFYCELFGGQVVLDQELAGARNVFIRIGTGRLHIYDQPPKRPGRGSIHHFGIQTDDIGALVRRLREKGIPLKKEITELGAWRYIMVPAPDDVLVEVFEVDVQSLPAPVRGYFD